MAKKVGVARWASVDRVTCSSYRSCPVSHKNYTSNKLSLAEAYSWPSLQALHSVETSTTEQALLDDIKVPLDLSSFSIYYMCV